MKSKLLEPIEFGPYRLPNRVVMSPMTRNRSPGEIPNALNGMIAMNGTAADYAKRMSMARQERERLIAQTGIKAE